MSDILSDDGLPGAPKPVGGRLAPYLVVVVVALLSSGALSTDPEPRTPSGSTTVPAAAPPALLAPGIVGEDPVQSPAPGEQAEFVEFGFDSQLGAVLPMGDAPAAAPALHRGESRQPVKQM